MKAKLMRDDLVEAVALANKVTPRHSSLPILSNVLLRAEGDRLHVEGTNLDTTLRTWTHAIVERAGQTTVPGKLLADALAKLAAGVCVLELAEDRLVLTADETRCTFPVIDADEFPVAPRRNGAVSAIPGPAFKRCIGQTQAAAARDECRPVLTGIHLALDGARLTAAATDGFRLAVSTVALDEPVETPFTAVLPAAALRLLAGLVEDDPVSIWHTVDRPALVFEAGRLWLAVQPIEGNFPNYELIVPKSAVTTATVDSQALLDVARLATVFGDRLELDVQPGERRVRCRTSSDGRAGRGRRP